jgi:flagellar biosynthesis protein FlhG
MITIAVTSGKGGVGKTSVVVNLAVALAQLRHRVAVLDADFGLGNIDVLLGLAPELHLGHLLAGERTIHDIMVTGPLGVRIIPASSGLRELTALTPAQWHRFNGACDMLARELDFLLIDTAPGISNNVLELLDGPGHVIIVTSPEPTAIVDAYAVVKILTQANPAKSIGLVVNGAAGDQAARTVFRQLDVAARRFLHRSLRYDGFVARDARVRDAVLAQRPIVEHLPDSPASRCFRALAARIAGLNPDDGRGLRLAASRAPQVDSQEVEVQQCA